MDRSSISVKIQRKQNYWLTADGKRPHSASSDEETETRDKVEDPLIKEQNEMLYSTKRLLSDSFEDTEQLAELLRHNNQDVPVGKDKVRN